MRDCDNCIHHVQTYNERLHGFVHSCSSWECEFERKENEDISDNACHEDRAEQSRKAEEGKA